MHNIAEQLSTIMSNDAFATAKNMKRNQKLIARRQIELLFSTYRFLANFFLSLLNHLLVPLQLLAAVA
jgi:hypothetical protein